MIGIRSGDTEILDQLYYGSFRPALGVNLGTVFFRIGQTAGAVIGIPAGSAAMLELVTVDGVVIVVVKE